MKYYVVADPHGYYNYMIAALREKGYFEDEGPKKLIVCGDAFDRGKEAVEMQNFLADLVAKDEAILIRGNHDDLLEEFVTHSAAYAARGLLATHHFSNGTVQTCVQLSGMDIMQMEVEPETLKEKMHETRCFRELLPAMVDYYETKRYIFVHGWIPCDASGFGGTADTFRYRANWRNATKDEWREARWYNGMLAASMGVIEPGKKIVCGHWHCSYGHSRLKHKGPEFGEGANFSPYKADGIIALDACTATSNKVNCIVIKD